eukprot:EG_transcript_20264
MARPAALYVILFMSLQFLSLGSGVLTEDSVRAMKIKDLRKFLDDRGIPCEGCVEKADFVKKALATKDTPVLDAKKPKVVNKEPIEKRWAPIVDEVCKANTDKEDFCKQLKGVIDGSFFQYMRKYKRELSVSEPHVADVSMTHPYLLIGKKIIKEVVLHMVQQDSKKADVIRAKLEPRFIPWFRDVCLENPNPMFEELGEMGANMKKKGRRADEL